MPVVDRCLSGRVFLDTLFDFLCDVEVQGKGSGSLKNHSIIARQIFSVVNLFFGSRFALFSPLGIFSR